MRTVVLWNPDCFDVAGEITVVKDSDFVDYISIEGTLDTKPAELYRIPSAVETGHASLLFYLKYKYLETTGEKVQVKGSSVEHEFFKTWEQFVLAVNRCDYSCVESNFKKMDLGILPKMYFQRTPKLIEMLSDATRIVSELLVIGSPIRFTFPLNRKNNWWEDSPTTSDLKKIISTFDKYSGRTTIDELKGKLDKIIQRLSRWETRKTDEALIVAGELFFGIAQHWLSNNYYSQASLFLHRSFDCLLQYYGIQEGIISVRTDGLKYNRNTKNEGKDVYLSGTEYALVMNGSFQSNHKRRDFIKSFNRARNNLAQTHGMYGESKDQCEVLLQKVRHYIELMYKKHEVDLDSISFAYSNEFGRLNQSYPAGCSEVIRPPLGRSIATLEWCHSGVLFWVVNDVCCLRMDSPFRLIL